MSVRSVLTNNFWLKLISLACGIVIYLQINSMIKTEETILVDVTVKLDLSNQKPSANSEDANIEFKLKEDQFQVDAKFRGPNNKIAELTRKPMRMVIVLKAEEGKTLKAESYNLALLREDFTETLSKDIQVDFLGKVLKVELEELIEKNLSVDMRNISFSREQFYAKNPRSNEILINVKGPRRVVEELKKIDVKPIEIPLTLNMGAVKIPLVDNINGVAITTQPKEVHVKFDVFKNRITVTVSDVPVKYLANDNDKLDVSFEPNRIDLEVEGPPMVDDKPLKDIGSDYFFVFVNLSGVTATDSVIEEKIKVWKNPILNECTVKAKIQEVKVQVKRLK